MNWKNLLPKPKNLIPGRYMGLIPFIGSGAEEDQDNGMSGWKVMPKAFGGVIYLTVMGFALMNYGIYANETGEFNPFRQREAITRIKTEERLERQAYQENFQKIFGPNGYADTNGNKAINFDERVNSYRKMGFFENEVPIAGETEFSKPTLNQLEKAVKSYKNK